jgi:hypothetical protein
MRMYMGLTVFVDAAPADAGLVLAKIFKCPMVEHAF